MDLGNLNAVIANNEYKKTNLINAKGGKCT